MARQDNFRRGVWVPAFAGTTVVSCGAIASYRPIS